MVKQFLFAIVLSFGFASCETISNLPTGLPSGTITETEAAQGIREALDAGVSQGIALLNKENGFFGNEAYKVLLPPDAQKVESTLRKLGMDGMVDRAILQINRAAEDAVGYARPIFVNAIKEMTIADALNIVKGPKDAATQYFQQKTTDKLIAAFSPVVKQSLDKFSATKYYTELITTYNNFPTTLNKVNPDLPSYVVGRTVDALFDNIAKEEANIRENPRARSTEILKKVFGWAARG
ncbi:MAG: DUF4197 domain-containing protein [Flavisolibacter sp.]|nr:DUF4197 domain-containing protein [Flavisolibacter sp.]